MTSLEVAVLFPLTLVLILVTVQASLWFFARTAALAAARAGARDGAAYHSTPAAGVATARSFLGQQAGDMLSAAHVSPDGSTATVTRITVTGSAISLVPFLPITVTQSAQLPDETFTLP